MPWLSLSTNFLFISTGKLETIIRELNLPYSLMQCTWSLATRYLFSRWRSLIYFSFFPQDPSYLTQSSLQFRLRGASVFILRWASLTFGQVQKCTRIFNETESSFTLASHACGHSHGCVWRRFFLAPETHPHLRPHSFLLPTKLLQKLHLTVTSVQGRLNLLLHSRGAPRRAKMISGLPDHRRELTPAGSLVPETPAA